MSPFRDASFPDLCLYPSSDGDEKNSCGEPIEEAFDCGFDDSFDRGSERGAVEVFVKSFE